jgi:hypothetical protein
MTKASILMAQIEKVQFGGGKKEILDLLNESEEEVFSREEIRNTLSNYKPLTIGQYLEELRRKDEIESVKFRGRAYYGNKKIIAKIKAKLKEERGKKETIGKNAQKK